MQYDSDSKKLALFGSLFKGREDVFALRWEKENKKGYMPAYSYDPYMYRLHKQKGGSFQNYKDKTYLKLDDIQIKKHLEGKQSIGIYPLLKDNTSKFIVADFDKEGWQEQTKKAISICEEFDIPAYLERSRSGNGGHVWIFFDVPYPAIKSRKILMELFEQVGVFSVFDKNNSFDRLFPNQDFLSGKGLGNLIALPLQGEAIKKQNACFINPETLKPYDNQWQFFKEIKRVNIKHLDAVFEKLFGSNTVTTILQPQNFQIKLKNSVSLNRNGLPLKVITFLKEQLNFYNSEYAIKKNSGLSTWKTERYFKLIDEKEGSIDIPRGFIGRLIRFCKQNSIDYTFLDERKLLEDVLFSSSIQLLPHQKTPVEVAIRKDFGIIVAPPGSGKTIIGLKLIEQKKQPALIITHRKQIADQWMGRIETFFGIPRKEIGKIGQGKTYIGEKITVALIQSLSKKIKEDPKSLTSVFGTIIIDECHHIPAKSFRDSIHQLSPYYQYGLTATPFRKTNDEKLLFIYLGEIISEIKPQQIATFKKARVIVRETSLEVPFNSKTDTFETVSKILIHDSERNKMILNDVEKEINSGRKAVIITERIEHIISLYQYLKNRFEVITLSGDDSKREQEEKWESIRQGNYQVIITTGQYFGEGTDIKDISCLFLVYPFAFKGKLIQYIGRVQRSGIKPIIYDYRDKLIPYLEKLFLKRNVYYRNLDQQATLFDDLDENSIQNSKSQKIEKTVRVPIHNLDFHYGMVCFSYKLPQSPTLLEFEIENEEVQPAFEVLKPYFSKVLHSNFINVRIQVEFENDKVVSQIAFSEEIDRINKEIIESVKFQFVEQQFIRKKPSKIPKKQEEELKLHLKEFYNSENNLLNTLLENNSYIHYKQLHYLAKNHCSDILKIRFVVQPFSFVFLLKGQNNYHIALETLDTKEATYVWHLPKIQNDFKSGIDMVDKALNHIRINGRQSYQENASENFSRILHDYSDEKKGFYKWKNAIEERLL